MKAQLLPARSCCTLVRVLVVFMLLAVLAGPADGVSLAAPSAVSTAPRQAASPVLFVENAGQFDPAVRFQVIGADQPLWLGADGLHLTAGETPITLTFPGANPNPQIEPSAPRPAQVSYFPTSDRASWHVSVPVFGNVRYVDLYPGIDLVLTGVGRAVRGAFVVRPDGDPGAVRLAAAGAVIEVLPGGEGASQSLRLTSPTGQLDLPRFDLVDEAGRPLAAAAAQVGGQVVLAARTPAAASDAAPAPALPETQAPRAAAPSAPVEAELVFSTFIGGPVATQIEGIAVDAAGYIYATGYANAGLQVTVGPTGLDGAFIAKLAPDGATLAYLTYVGKGAGRGRDIAVLPDGTAYVVGEVDINGRNVDGRIGFPTTPGVFSQECVSDWGVADIFLIKLNPDGNYIEFSTCLDDLNDYESHDYALSLDRQGNALIGGNSYGWTFPFTEGMTDCPYGPLNAMALRVKADGTGLIWASCFVGNGSGGVFDVASLPDGTAYLQGRTNATNFPHTSDSFDSTFNAPTSDFVLKMSPDGKTMVYGTFLDKSYTSAIAVDSAGGAYLAGSVSVPAGDPWYTTPGAFDRTPNGSGDAFLARLNPDGRSLSGATFLGGKGYDAARDIALASTSVTVLGQTYSCDFPTTRNAAFGTLTPGICGTDTPYPCPDLFVTRLTADLTDTEYSSFLGGSGFDWVGGLALVGYHPIVAGQATTPDFPTTVGAFDGQFAGAYGDSFIARFRANGEVLAPPSCDSPTVEIRGKVTVPLANRPLIGARVYLTQNGSVVRSTVTQAPDGSYRFANAPRLNYLRVQTVLDYAETDPSGFRIIYNAINPPRFGYANTLVFSAVDATATIEKDVRFENGPNTETDPNIPKRFLPDLGLLYYHAWEAFQLARQNNLPLDLRLPLDIYTFSPDPEVKWVGPGTLPGGVADAFINIGAADGASERTDGSRPDNREWHEIGHHVLADSTGNRMPYAAGDENHGGPTNNSHTNPTTTDAWAEGFAEFYSLEVGAEFAHNGRPGMYKVGGGTLLNLEANYSSIVSGNNEELAVAGLLWDLVDPVDAGDATYQFDASSATTDYADCIQIPAADLWSIIKTDWTGKVAGAQEAQAAAYGYIFDVKQLYDVLKFKGIGQAQSRARGYTDLDELFISHGFFADTDPMNDAWDAGETVGLAGYTAWTTPGGFEVPARPTRRDVPQAPGSYLAFSAKSEAGADVPVDSFLVEVSYAAPFEHFSYTYIGRPTKAGRLYYYGPDRHFAATTKFTPQAPSYKALGAYTITNADYWAAMDQGPADHFAQQAFVLQESATHLYLPLVLRGVAAATLALEQYDTATLAYTPRACVPEPRPTRTPTPTRTPGPPVIDAVAPTSAGAGSLAQITVYGAFDPAAVALIGTTPLSNLAYLGAEPQPPYRLRLQGNLPGSVGPGIYDVTVRNPDGKLASIPGGFTVTQAIGTPTPTTTATGSGSATNTPSATPSPTLTGDATATPTFTPSGTSTPPVETETPSPTPTNVATATPTVTPSPSATPSRTWTPSPTATGTSTATPTPAGGWQIVFADNFEGSFPGAWEGYGDSGAWGRTACRKYGGSYAVWPAVGAAEPCTQNYPNDMASVMIAGPFDLTGATSAELTYQLWQRLAADGDTFMPLASWDGLMFTGLPATNTDGWRAMTFDLQDFVGEPEVWIGFYFESDPSGADAGVWVDDVVLRKK